MSLHLIEAATGGPFRYRHEGVVYRAHDPADLPFQVVLRALQVEVTPEGPPLPLWKQRQLGRAWAAHYDLPDFQSAQRLAYLLDRYRPAITYDLHHWCQVDAGELWRARRWRTMLDLIDHLPGWSWYASAVFNDEEHAAMLAESMKAQAEGGEKPTGAPPQHHWTPEVQAITTLTDAVNQITYVTSAANGGKPSPPKPMPRPLSPLEKALKRNEFERRQAAHESLVARLLPHKAKGDESSH
jgi:hypothetical protein